MKKVRVDAEIAETMMPAMSRRRMRCQERGMMFMGGIYL